MLSRLVSKLNFVLVMLKVLTIVVEFRFTVFVFMFCVFEVSFCLSILMLLAGFTFLASCFDVEQRLFYGGAVYFMIQLFILWRSCLCYGGAVYFIWQLVISRGFSCILYSAEVAAGLIYMFIRGCQCLQAAKRNSTPQDYNAVNENCSAMACIDSLECLGYWDLVNLVVSNSGIYTS
jgi:hypothetical protein